MADELSPLTDLRGELDQILADEALRGPEARPRLLTLACAVISEGLDRHGMRAVLVGGGAIEFHAPGAYATEDVDLVVQSRTGPPERRRLHDVFTRSDSVRGAATGHEMGSSWRCQETTWRTPSVSMPLDLTRYEW